MLPSLDVDACVMRRFASSVCVVVSAAACCAAFAQARSAAPDASWAAQVNVACERSQVQFNQLPKSDGTTAQLLVVLPKLTAISAALLADIRRVPAAPSQRPAVARLVKAWNDEIVYDRVAYQRLKISDMVGFKASLNRIFFDQRAEGSLLRALGSTCRRT